MPDQLPATQRPEPLLPERRQRLLTDEDVQAINATGPQLLADDAYAQTQTAAQNAIQQNVVNHHRHYWRHFQSGNHPFQLGTTPNYAV